MRAFIVITTCATLLAPALGGCGGDKDEARRALLRPVDMNAKRRAEREKMRIVDAKGELIPSDQKIAGITLPKGIELYRSFELEWYLEGKHIEMGQLERYFSARLDPLAVERGQTFTTFKDARLRGEPNARRVTVELSRKFGGTTTTDVYIRQMRPPRVFVPEKQAEAQLQARRQRAE
jgi:hypothetical protein